MNIHEAGAKTQLHFFAKQSTNYKNKMWFDNIEILLASKSPRRASLLNSLNIPTKIVEIEVCETIDPMLSIDKIAESIALKKAAGYQSADLLENQVLITADTIVAHNGTVMGKPHNREEALAMLKQLSGQQHNVYTGVCMKSAKRQICFTECSQVQFNNLEEEEILFYTDTYKPYDKAGAYGIQEWIGLIGVKEIKGCYYNIMGLPVNALYRHMKDLMV